MPVQHQAGHLLNFLFSLIFLRLYAAHVITPSKMEIPRPVL